MVMTFERASDDFCVPDRMARRIMHQPRSETDRALRTIPLKAKQFSVIQQG